MFLKSTYVDRSRSVHCSAQCPPWWKHDFQLTRDAAQLMHWTTESRSARCWFLRRIYSEIGWWPPSSSVCSVMPSSRPFTRKMGSISPAKKGTKLKSSTDWSGDECCRSFVPGSMCPNNRKTSNDCGDWLRIADFKHFQLLSAMSRNYFRLKFDVEVGIRIKVGIYRTRNPNQNSIHIRVHLWCVNFPEVTNVSKLRDYKAMATKNPESLFDVNLIIYNKNSRSDGKNTCIMSLFIF